MKIWSGRMMLDKLREHGLEIILTLTILFLTFHTHASHVCFCGWF
jgi:hypothetical protein